VPSDALLREERRPGESIWTAIASTSSTGSAKSSPITAPTTSSARFSVSCSGEMCGTLPTTAASSNSAGPTRSVRAASWEPRTGEGRSRVRATFSVWPCSSCVPRSVPVDTDGSATASPWRDDGWRTPAAEDERLEAGRARSDRLGIQ
jgi:hypothetical protein